MALGLALAVLPACADDETEVPEALRGEPTCMWIAETRLYFQDGSSSFVHDPETGRPAAVCTCTTREEYDAGDWQDELSLRALELCEQLADRSPYIWHDCLDDYESGAWLDFVTWGDEGDEVPASYDPGCVGA